MRYFAWMAAVLMLGWGTLGAAPVSSTSVDQLVEDYFALRPSQAFPAGLTPLEALGVQNQFVARISARLGKRVGYKVGLITREAQAKYGVTAPVRGVLLSKMLLSNGVDIPARFGAKPICEADLMVVVKDRGINKAKTQLEVAEHLQQVTAFIELPDAFLADTRTIDGSLLTAANVGARYGVIGESVAVVASAGFVTSMEDMTVTMMDQNGAVLARQSGRTILDNPLNAVLWLKEELARSGEKLHAGDVLSLGSFKAITPEPGQTITVRYDGLPGGPIKVSVRFK